MSDGRRSRKSRKAAVESTSPAPNSDKVNGKMNVERRKLTDLRAAEYNPRKKLKPEDKEYQHIKSSIEYFGLVDPIIINKNNTIIGGHQRSSVLHELGYDEIDCVVLDLSLEDEKALNIALNKLDGAWDTEELAKILNEMESDKLFMTGFDELEMEHILKEHESLFSLEGIGDLSEYEEPDVKKWRCPACKHVDEAKRFVRSKTDEGNG